ncbi:MAG: RagB/SusD family nutrient uptake outer membrane protein [Bacteroidaceae bacterium]|nr:RagB/SusD family nutrient uptake outer membrane protein [Bacteroidaceae bacterium]
MKHINYIIKALFCGVFLSCVVVSFTSCKSYLDKAPDSNVAENEAFKNFKNFQGYVEEIYNCIPDKEKCNWCPSWNWGDDEVFNPEAYDRMTHQVDLGNYRAWTNGLCWLNRGNVPTSQNSFDHSLYPHAWYCIRKCNLGLENMEKYFYGSDEERNLLQGQMYFFRAWWHFEMMCYLGGIPYVEEAFSSEVPNLPRLSFQEAAAKCAEDFRKAADLLPINWDDTAAGVSTYGNNQLRINKIMALGYLGKCLLWAGSPLMENKDEGVVGASKGGAGALTYKYNTTLCSKAAEALGELLTYVESGQTQYDLAKFEYSNVYDHVRETGSSSCFSDIFYTVSQNWQMPGSVEAIFRGPSFNGDGNANNSNWNTSKVFGPKNAKVVAHDNVIHQPTANLIDQYGMKNGQPIYFVQDGRLVLNPNSGWDPKYPYKNRDPRFYHDIVFDGFHYVLAADVLPTDMKPYEYCTLYTGGDMRDVAISSQTGYFCQKLVPHQCNEGDQYYDWGHSLHCYLPYMRLADIYLMYAEACAAVSGATGKATNCSLTAEAAINKLRDRVGCGNVVAEVKAERHLFIDEVRRERAVELAFEGFRWCDLQRWLLLTEAPYNEKYSHEFERVKSDAWYVTNDPAKAEVANFHSESIIKRNLEAKHYWFPFPDKEVYLFPEFKQNKGWE